MRARRSLAIGLLLLAACGKKKEEPPAPLPPGPDRELALPASTEVIIGVSVARIAGSPLARKLVTEAVGRDPDARAKLDETLAACKIDVLRDVESITIAMGTPADVALIARGKFDPRAVTDCAREHKVFLHVDDKLAVVATTEGWLGEIMDPRGPKTDQRAETVALLGRVDQKKALWGVGYLPAGAGARLVKLTDGAIAAPAKAMIWEVDAQSTLAASLRMDMVSADDAAGLAKFARGQMDFLAMAAQKYGLGRMASKLEITSEGATVKVALALDEAELRQVAAAFAGQAGIVTKEQVR